jgi:hypothetical protein
MLLLIQYLLNSLIVLRHITAATFFIDFWSDIIDEYGLFLTKPACLTGNCTVVRFTIDTGRYTTYYVVMDMVPPS